MDLQITKAKSSDIPLIASILTEAVNYKLDRGDNAWGKEKYTNDEIKPRIEDGNTYVAKISDEIVGTLMLIWEDNMMWGEQPPSAGYIHQMSIKQGFHGQHLGVKIMDWAAQQVAKKNRHFLRLDCPPHNASLCAYYEHQGFKRVTVRDIHRPNYPTYAAALYERPV